MRVVVDRGVSFDQALAMLRAQPRAPPQARIGFNLSRHPLLGPDKAVTLSLARRPVGATAAAAAAEAEAATNGGGGGEDNDTETLSHVPYNYVIVRPNTGVAQNESTLSDIARVYDRCVSEAAARRRWTEIYNQTLERCIHGASCAAVAEGLDCRVGCRTQSVFLLSGSVVRVWQTLQRVLTAAGRAEAVPRGTDRLLPLVRARLPNGERCLGIRYPEVLIDAAHSEIQRQARAAEAKAAAAVAAAAAGGNCGDDGGGDAAAAAASAAAAAARPVGPPPPEAPAPVDRRLFEQITDYGAAALDEAVEAAQAASRARLVAKAAGGGGGGGGSSTRARPPAVASGSVAVKEEGGGGGGGMSLAQMAAAAGAAEAAAAATRGTQGRRRPKRPRRRASSPSTSSEDEGEEDGEGATGSDDDWEPR